MSKGLKLFIINASRTPAEKMDLNPPPSITNDIFSFLIIFYLKYSYLHEKLEAAANDTLPYLTNCSSFTKDIYNSFLSR